MGRENPRQLQYWGAHKSVKQPLDSLKTAGERYDCFLFSLGGILHKEQ